MIDRLAASFRYLQRLPDESSYSPEQAVADSILSDNLPDGDMMVVFPFWRQTEAANRRLQQQLQQQQKNSLIFQFSPLILNKDPQSVKASFEVIVERAAERINQVASNNQRKINLLGISLGNVSLAMTAEKLDRFNDVTMVVPGADLAKSLWLGARTKRLRQSYESQGYDLGYLQNEWSNLAPIHHLQPLVGHDVRVLLARKDLFIPYMQGHELVNAMDHAGIAPNVQITAGGHVSTLAKYLMGQIDSNR